MKSYKVIKLILEELVSFIAWAAPTLWSMFSQTNHKDEEIHSMGDIYSEDGHVFTMYDDGSTETGPGGPKKPIT